MTQNINKCHQQNSKGLPWQGDVISMQENKTTRLLLVDDDERNLRILELILEDEFHISMAGSGEQALESVRVLKPDIILLDIMMPGISGIEVCKEIKSSAEYKDIKVILLSGKAMTEDRVAGYEVGADDYLAKPFNDEELIAKVRVYAKLKSSEQVNQLKTNFLSLITHETSTPLNTIIGYASLLEGEEHDEEKREFIQDIKSSALHLHKKIGKILQLSTLMCAEPVEKHDVHLAELIMLSMDDLDVELDAESRIDIDIQDECVVCCDQLLLQQVISMLLDNSIRHTPENSRTRCSCGNDSEGYLEISVTDQGNGIDVAALAHLFEPFEVPDILSHREGLSISLTLCQRIINLHGGYINAVNLVEGGFRATISIPYR